MPSDISVLRDHMTNRLRHSLKNRAEAGPEAPHLFALLSALADETQLSLALEDSSPGGHETLGEGLQINRELLGYRILRVPSLKGYNVTLNLAVTVSIEKLQREPREI